MCQDCLGTCIGKCVRIVPGPTSGSDPEAIRDRPETCLGKASGPSLDPPREVDSDRSGTRLWKQTGTIPEASSGSGPGSTQDPPQDADRDSPRISSRSMLGPYRDLPLEVCKDQPWEMIRDNSGTQEAHWDRLRTLLGKQTGINTEPALRCRHGPSSNCLEKPVGTVCGPSQEACW